MSADTDPTRPATAEATAQAAAEATAQAGAEATADTAAAPLDLLLADAATGMLRRVNPGGRGLRLAAALAVRPRLVAGRGRHLIGELARIAIGKSQVEPSYWSPSWTRRTPGWPARSSASGADDDTSR